jgi:hypothetical protein
VYITPINKYLYRTQKNAFQLSKFRCFFTSGFRHLLVCLAKKLETAELLAAAFQLFLLRMLGLEIPLPAYVLYASGLLYGNKDA